MMKSKPAFLISANRCAVLAYGCGGQNSPIGKSGPPVNGNVSGDGTTAGAAPAPAAPTPAAAALVPPAAEVAAPVLVLVLVVAAAVVVEAAVAAAAVRAVAPAPSSRLRRLGRLGSRHWCGLCMILLRKAVEPSWRQ